MAPFAVQLDKLLAATDIVDEILLRLQFAAQLVRVGDFQFRAQLHAALIRLQLAEDQLDQGRLAGTVGAYNADPVTALDDAGEIANDGLVVKVLADVFQLRHHFAGAARLLHDEVGTTYFFPALLTFAAHLFQRPHAALVAGAPCLDTLANPHLFLRQFLVKQRIGALFRFQLLIAVGEEALVAALPTGEMAAVQFRNARGNALQKASVVCNQHNRAAVLLQLCFQPLDGGDVEVVGGFVQ